MSITQQTKRGSTKKPIFSYIRNILLYILRIFIVSSYLFSYTKIKKGGISMATILPVSDLRNYNTVLEHVSEGTPVYLTVNGRGRYIIRDIADENEYEKMRSMLILMCDLLKGSISADQEKRYTIEEVEEYIKKTISKL